MLSGLLDAPWVRTDDAQKGDDEKFLRALQELSAYALDEAGRIEKMGHRFWNTRPKRTDGSILLQVKDLLQRYRDELVRESNRLDQGGRA